jgi:hypothetical protein
MDDHGSLRVVFNHWLSLHREMTSTLLSHFSILSSIWLLPTLILSQSAQGRQMGAFRRSEAITTLRERARRTVDTEQTVKAAIAPVRRPLRGA